jgi:hypothetical protein
MPAFRRRTHFATPVIVIAACSSSKTPPKAKEFPGPTWNVIMKDMKCVATEPGPNPPPPQAIECPPGMTGNISITVGMLANKSCGVVPTGCFDPACVKLATACPLPPGEQVKHELANVWLVEKRGDRCHAEEGDIDKCPPGVDCNPPEPRFVKCPEGVTEDTPMRIAELPDATCVVVPDGCRDTSCATQKISCPE